MMEFVGGVLVGFIVTTLAYVLSVISEDVKIKMISPSNDELQMIWKCGRKNGTLEFAEQIKAKYSQADILCPRKVISLTEQELYELVEEMTEDGEEDA